MFRGLSCTMTTSKEWSLPRRSRVHDKKWAARRIRKFNRRNEGYLQHDSEIQKYTINIPALKESSPNPSGKYSGEGFSSINLFLVSGNLDAYRFPEKRGE
jgi:hypothetical protein